MAHTRSQRLLVADTCAASESPPTSQRHSGALDGQLDAIPAGRTGRLRDSSCPCRSHAWRAAAPSSAAAIANAAYRCLHSNQGAAAAPRLGCPAAVQLCLSLPAKHARVVARLQGVMTGSVAAACYRTGSCSQRGLPGLAAGPNSAPSFTPASSHPEKTKAPSNSGVVLCWPRACSVYRTSCARGTCTSRLT